MPEIPSEEPAAENVRAIRQLVRLMKRYDLTAIDFLEGGTQIRLRRRGPEVAHAAPAPAPVAYQPAPAPVPTHDPVTAPAPAAPSGIVIESPMVGTYYASSSPDAAPFVSIGTQVRVESTVCVIEAMKVFTDIPAGFNGTILEILVKNGQPVEYGQPLFRINPA
jgi:acetyl-CoA carboxylase biotin carboxyl carrier protein